MDMKQIKALLQEFDASTLSKLKITQDAFSIELEKNIGVVAAPVMAAPIAVATTAVAAPVAVEAAAPVHTGDMIVSPMVGTFYGSPSPDSAPFVKVGDRVKKGQVIGILEAMKIMNELEAEFDCKIVSILVSDSQAVEYDMPLFAVEKL
ncbi:MULTISPECIES: acetyl-CoA carboxylase biotin carboxyl carrier protein [unclassified Sulfuricurvum]|uniref:acetyl-CoA carboxylase biotin carboxyl carrier protein n=1 Tax=unclassified Sulfuricurvum TaxID=2632390 RepID=UPI00029980E1|nr:MULTISPECIES: acetyl-CoA carboxylase biotin carboxyl carrier protein [unclassified Sulfuricurvum]OHD84667.1 MAG: acetyl-CoA carboxylase, biotin carboxyl carrier protein [Sulfuricurvum sp. RIFCSPHIGHO2_12_FULL_44_8]OHD84968.1 MAG: acetyl-CoA carboxylase, biotin carboxyl carrier protein [Sulfuricurvum sp. RIFCSPHIGHO2_02_FULL_43_9]OHD85245.1 MAG: acetyl-CoA carboxylase, biotin carboxyl carrier protein [Sulfuricurvum sp. RIFCSPLOWO2_02_FULL_43_45]OHD87159.1 MAG: acetyl-CoA carboxylase, biotin c